MAFHVGQLVACVEDRPDAIPQPPGYVTVSKDMSGLKKAQIYTIRETFIFYGVPCVRLEEIVRELTACGVETPFLGARFRPIQPTSIEIFTAMLAPKETEKA